jgi:transcriptional regulator with XRE-family HTH domain
MNTDRLRKLFEKSNNRHGDARKIGVSYETMMKILDGRDLKVSTLEKIAKFYNVPVGYFFDEADADGWSEQQLQIENMKGQIKGMQETLDRLGFSMKGLIIDDN